MRDTLTDNVRREPWPFGRPSYLGSKLTRNCELVGKTALPTKWSTDETSASRQLCKVKFLQDYERNRLIPSGKWVPVPVNNEVVWEFATRTRGQFKRTDAIVVGGRSSKSLRRFRGRQVSQLTADVWRNSRMLVGNSKSESNQKCLSVVKGTRETQSSMAVAWIGCRKTTESLPMRRLSVGASIVVRGRENRPHGEGRQDVSFWTVVTFNNREGSR